MSYRRHNDLGLQGLGVDFSTIAEGVSTAADVAADPYLPETICRTRQLLAIEGKRPVPVCTRTRDGLQGGIGLRKAMPVMRGYVYAETHRWVYPAAIAAVIGVPFLLGFFVGKGAR